MDLPHWPSGRHGFTQGRAGGGAIPDLPACPAACRLAWLLLESHPCGALSFNHVSPYRLAGAVESRQNRVWTLGCWDGCQGTLSELRRGFGSLSVVEIRKTRFPHHSGGLAIDRHIQGSNKQTSKRNVGSGLRWGGANIGDSLACGCGHVKPTVITAGLIRPPVAWRTGGRGRRAKW